MDAGTVLAAATDAALAEFDDDLIAVYTIGSLAHGGFAPAVGDPEDLLHGGVRRVTKTVLFPVRFLHTLRTGGLGRNDAAVASYADARGPHTALATAALDWRSGSLGDRVVARELLTAHLPGLYRECVDAHLTALPSGDPSVPVLRSMRGALDVGGV